MLKDFRAVAGSGSVASQDQTREAADALLLRSKTWSVEQRLGSGAAAALLGKGSAELSIEELRRHSTLLAQLEPALQKATRPASDAKSKHSRDIQMIRLGGYPVTGLPSHVAGLPLVRDVSRGCLRMASSPADHEPDLNTLRSRYVFNIAGFPYAGHLAFISRKASKPSIEACSIFMVTANQALTAAHCLFADGDRNSPRDVSREEHRLFLAKGEASEERLVDACYERIVGAGCAYHVGRITHVRFLRTLTWEPPERRAPPHPDVAVLTVDFGGYAPSRLPRLAPADAKEAKWITLVGFGARPLEQDRPGIELQAAWQNTTLVSGQPYFRWSQESTTTAGGICKGDSGGPVLLGFRNGADAEVHEVTGIISYTVTDGSGGKACKNGDGFAVNLAMTLRSPLCQAVAMAGC